MTTHITTANDQYGGTHVVSCTRCPGWRLETRHESVAQHRAAEHEATRHGRAS